MTNNDILRRVRYALDLSDSTLLGVFELGGLSVSAADLHLLLRKEDDPAWINCPDVLLSAFLDGLIISRRGPRDDAPEAGTDELNNNQILRKLRIALELKDTDLIRILLAGGLKLTKSQLSALFRHPDHRNYMHCGDQLLRKFLTGLAATTREA